MSYIKDMALMGMRNTATSPSGSAVNADWAENNPNSASYVKNRTHYAGRNVTFDGSLDGKEYIYMEDEGFCVVKVSDTPITEEDLNGLLITAVGYEGTRVFELSNDDYELMQGGIILSNYFSSTPFDIEYKGIPFTRGLYFAYYAEDSYIKAITTGAKRLDEVYMPEAYHSMKSDIENLDYDVWHSINDINNTLINYQNQNKVFRCYPDSAEPNVYRLDNPFSYGYDGIGIHTILVLNNEVQLYYAGFDGENQTNYFSGIYKGECYELTVKDWTSTGTLTKRKLAFATE